MPASETAQPSEEAPVSMTGLKTTDETVHVTNAWIHEVTSRMGWDDRQKGYRLLRVFFHTLRDRLPVNEAAQLAAQLPMLLRGVFFEGWRPSRTPTKRRACFWRIFGTHSRVSATSTPKRPSTKR